MFILIIDTTYSHNYRCVYVVYPNMLTIPGATGSLISGGGGVMPGMGNTTLKHYVKFLICFQRHSRKLFAHEV